MTDQYTPYRTGLMQVVPGAPPPQSDYVDPASLPPPTTRITVAPNQAAAPDDDWEDVPNQPSPPPVTPTVAPAAAPAQAANPPTTGGQAPSPGLGDDWEEDSAIPGAATARNLYEEGRARVVGERDVDYHGDVPFGLKVEMARAQNPDEAKLVLDKYVGPGNSGQDRNGNWWIRQGDKKVAVFPSGILPTGPKTPIHRVMETIPMAGPIASALNRSPAASNMAAHLSAAATPIAGSALGASLMGYGAAGGTLGGPLGTAVGAGIGAAAGYGIDQLIKYYRGLYAQKPTEVAKNAINEATLNTAMTGAIPVAQAIGRGAGNAVRGFLGVTPQSAKMTSQLVGEGVRPPIKTVSPEFRSWGDKQVLRNLIGGDPWEATNTEYIRRRFENALRASGTPEGEVASIIESASSPTSAPSRTAAGEALVGRVQQHIGDLQADAIANRQAATDALRGMERSLRQWSQGVGRNMETLGEDAAQTFINHRRALGRAAHREYTAIDAMTGDRPVFNLDNAFNRARHIVDLADPGLVPPYVRQLAVRGERVEAARREIPTVEREIARMRAAGEDTSQIERRLAELRAAASDNMTTFAEAHEIRNNLREIVGEYSPIHNPFVGKVVQVEDAIDDGFRALESSPDITGQAAQRLRLMDARYREGIQVFKDQQINELIRSIRSGTSIDPEAVMNIIAREGNTASGRRILQMLPVELRENAARADMRNILHEASSRGPNGELQLDGIRLLDALDARKRAGLLGELHHPRDLEGLRTLAGHLGALEGRVSVDALPDPSASVISAQIRRSINAVNQIDQFVAGNPVGALARGTPAEVDRAARMLSLPGNEARTAEAARFFGPDSPEWKSVQRHAVQGLIRQSLLETASGRMSISGPAIEKALKRYTPAQQELLFPEGLADDLREVARQAKFLFPPNLGGGSDIGTSQAAKSITLHTGLNILNPRTAYADMRWAYTMAMGWVTDRPAVLRFLSDTAKKNPSEARALIGFIMRSQMNAQRMGPGRRAPTQEREQQQGAQ